MVKINLIFFKIFQKLKTFGFSFDKLVTNTTLPFLNKQTQSRNKRENLFKTVEINSVDISVLCPRAVFSTIREREIYIYIDLH